MLVPLSHVLSIRASFSRGEKGGQYSALFSCFLLVCNDSFDGQSYSILPHESKVSKFVSLIYLKYDQTIALRNKLLYSGFAVTTVMY